MRHLRTRLADHLAIQAYRHILGARHLEAAVTLQGTANLIRRHRALAHLEYALAGIIRPLELDHRP